MRTRHAASSATSIALVALIAVGAALRSAWLTRHGMWWDEAGLWSDALSGQRSPNEAPLNTWLTYLTMALLRRDDATALHVPALVFGSLTIPAAFVLGRRLAGDACGVASALLVTVSPSLLAFSQDARPYALLILLTTTELTAALALCDGWTVRRVALLMALTTAALATHLLALPFSAGIHFVLLLALAWRARRDPAGRSRWLGRAAVVAGAGALAFALGLSWLLFRPSMKPVIEAHYPFGASEFMRYVLVRATTYNPEPEYRPPSWNVADAIAAAHVVVALAGCIVLVARRRLDRLLMLAIGSAALLAAVYSSLGPKSGWPWMRYATPIIVPLFALVAVGATASRRLWIAAPLVVGLVALCGHERTGWASWARYSRQLKGDDNRAAALDIRRLGDALSGVIFDQAGSYYGDETVRLAAGYLIYRADELPMYVSRRRRGVSHVRLVPGPGAIPVPILMHDGPLRLPDGDYAIFTRWRTDCHNYNAQLLNSPLQRRGDGSLLICRAGGGR